MNYSNLTDGDINWRVAVALGLAPSWRSGAVVGLDKSTVVNYCNSWADMGPIIQEYRIQICWNEYDTWFAAEYFNEWLNKAPVYDKNPLRAAAICFLMMKDSDS